MLIAIFLAPQAAQAAPSPATAEPATAPDIALDIHAPVREVRIQQSGDTSLELRAEPDGGTLVDVDRPDSDGPHAACATSMSGSGPRPGSPSPRKSRRLRKPPARNDVWLP